MALSKEQQDQLAELERLRDAPDDEGGEYGGDVIMLRGGAAEAFLKNILGDGSSGPAPKKTAAPKKSARNSARTPAKTASDDDAGAEDDDDEDQGASDDPTPPAAHRYFR